MAERKPTTRKAAAKKPATRRTPAKKATPAEQPKEAAPPAEPTAQEKAIIEAREKVELYKRLQEEGLPIPAELRAEVEASRPEGADERPAQRFVRNLNHTLFRFKLNSHQPGQRGIVLQARGTRGDLQPISNADLNDPNLQANINMGLVEIITHAEAQEVVNKQTTNQQSVHPALAALRNAKGEAYEEGAFSVGPSPDEAAITVAKLNDGQIAFDRGGIAQRVRGDAPGVPEYVTGAEPGPRPANEDPAYLSDLRARQRGANPADGLKVTVEAPVKANRGIISDGFNPEK